MHRAFFAFVTFLHVHQAWGQAPAKSVILPRSSLSASISTSAPALQPELKMWEDAFISANYEATNSKNFNFMGLSLQNSSDQEAIIKLDAQAAYAFNAPLMSYINVSEIYLDLPFSPANMQTTPSLMLGRRKTAWSELDARWNLGVWEPIFKWNPLVPERQGLTGLFLNFPGESFDIELMGSPFYLPSQGPSFQVDDSGQFEKGNPWFRRPADTIRVLGETSKVEYNFKRPNETDVVMQKTYSARARLKFESLSLQGSYAYKPMNQLPLGYTGVLDVSKDRAVVDIVTSIQYHELVGGDLKWDGYSVTTGLSVLHDHPSGEADFENEEKWTRPQYKDANLVSPYFDWRFAQGWALRLQHLSISGGEVTEVGPLAREDRPSISPRYPYQEAQSAELAYEGHLNSRRRWQSSLAYTLSQKNKFDIVRWRGQFQFGRMWNVFSEALLVRADVQTSQNTNEISEFDNHDRVLAGVGYVF